MVSIAVEKENISSHFLQPINLNEICTHSMCMLRHDLFNAFSNFFLLVELTSFSDEASKKFSKVLVPFAKSDEERKRYEANSTGPNRGLEKLKRFSRVNSKSLTNSCIDLFLWYIADVLKTAIRRRPDLLRSNEQIKVDEVLDYTNRKELIDFLVDRKINALAYGGIFGIEAYIKERLGLNLFPTEVHRNTLKFYNEVRNVNAHNRGFANSIFIKRVNGTLPHKFVEGDYVDVDFDDLSNLCTIILETVQEFDKQIARKFSIRRKKFKSHFSKEGLIFWGMA
jgi:hypothetical protein